MRTAREGKGLAPWVVVKAGLDFSAEGGELEKKLRVIREHGGKVLEVSSASEGGAWNWKSLLGVLYAEGITSLMIEGGAKVINGLLESKEDLEHVDSVIVTIAPVYLGKGGVNVSPDIHKGSGGGGQRDMSSAVQFKDVKWCVLGNDVVMAARPEI